MARIARTALVALVLAAFSFPATAGATSSNSSVRGCGPRVSQAHTPARPVAHIAPNRSSRCYRLKTRGRSAPVARTAI